MRVVFSVIVAALLFISETAAAGTLDRVRAAGVFKIGYRTDAPPFSYNSEIGEPAGYIVDLCREVAAAAKQELDLKDLKVEYVTVTAEDRFDAVKSGRVDLLCEATSVTLARRRLVDFSLMTFIDGASVMVRSDGPQSFKALAGHKIGVHAGTTTEDELRRTLADLKVEADVVPVADHADGVKRLESGELAAYFADRAILTYLLLGEGAPKTLRISKEYFTREPYALALARGDDDFRFMVDRTLARLYRGGAIGAIFARSFGKAKASEILQTLYAINALPE
ncbi:MAG TPA: amino acid ABC transporter substrate-binding protein [Candidatus Angelobacter sp.]|nr:amino acid ABC transporter substrate-binding protein [Candidatus Angelobacter sp.]